MTVVGIRRVDSDSERGSFHGFTLHCHDEDVVLDFGEAVDKFFVSDRVCSNSGYSPSVGDKVMPIYPKGSKSLKTILVLN